MVSPSRMSEADVPMLDGSSIAVAVAKTGTSIEGIALLSLSAELMTSSREVAVSIGVGETSVKSAEGETSDSTMVVAVG